MQINEICLVHEVYMHMYIQQEILFIDRYFLPPSLHPPTHTHTHTHTHTQ